MKPKGISIEGTSHVKYWLSFTGVVIIKLGDDGGICKPTGASPGDRGGGEDIDVGDFEGGLDTTDVGGGFCKGDGDGGNGGGGGFCNNGGLSEGEIGGGGFGGAFKPDWRLS